MIISLVISDRDDMIKMIYHDMRYHDNYRLTLRPGLDWGGVPGGFTDGDG